MIVDSGGRVFVLSKDLQPPQCPISAPARAAVAASGGGDVSDAFVAALRNTATTGPLVNRLIRAVHAEVDSWGDRLVEWQHSLNTMLRKREEASGNALLSPTENATPSFSPSSSSLSLHLQVPSIPRRLMAECSAASEARTAAAALAQRDEDGGHSRFGGLVKSESAQQRRTVEDTEFLMDNQWVLLRDFLISCCDPVCRTEIMNEYRVSSSSLSAAEAEGRYTMDDIRTVILYFIIMSTSRSLLTGAKDTVTERCMSPQNSEESPANAAMANAADNNITTPNNNNAAIALFSASSTLYSVSPLASFDAVMFSLLSSAVAGGGSSTLGACLPASVLALLQRNVIVDRNGNQTHIFPSGFVHHMQRLHNSNDHTHHGAGDQHTLSSASALTAIFIPRPIESALLSQGKDGRLKIVLRRKVGLWHHLLAEDEEREKAMARAAKEGRGQNEEEDATTGGVSFTLASHKNMMAHQLHKTLPPPPLRNYLCCSSRSYLEYLVTQMRFLFSPVILASARDLEDAEIEADSKGHHDTNNTADAEEDVDIDMDDLFGHDASDTRDDERNATGKRISFADDRRPNTHVNVSGGANGSHGKSGMARLLALLGGKVLPQMIFSDVEGKQNNSDATGDDSSSSISATNVSKPIVFGGVHNPSLLQQRLQQLQCAQQQQQRLAVREGEGEGGAASEKRTAFAVSAEGENSLAAADQKRLLLEKVRKIKSLASSSSASSDLSVNPNHLLPSAPSATATDARNGDGNTLVYCVEIKPNALRELRAILHDKYGINVDCYFDFLSEEDGAKKKQQNQKKDAATSSNPQAASERGEMAVANFTLKPGVALRPYQKASLERFCQDEKKVFQPAGGSSVHVEGETDDAENANGAAHSASSSESAEEQRRKAQLAEDAYNASLTGAANVPPSSNHGGNAIPPPTRRIAHHGIVVLPCGAGKTLTGIAASAMVGRRTIVMCINVLSVLQWRDQFLKWTCLRPDQVTVCTRDLKQVPSDVFITTYSMLTAQQPTHVVRKKLKRPKSANSLIDLNAPTETENSRLKKLIMKEISETAWGMLVLDEVHVAPASCFQTVVDKVKYHCILGLSATLLREDMGIEKLRYLVGPKLYEANWLELTRAGNLAPVMCAEVRCPLPPSMLKQYLMHKGGHAEEARALMRREKGAGGGTKGRKNSNSFEDDDNATGSDADSEAPAASSRRMQVDIECINPYKLWCTQALVAFHESRTPPDKTIIFCDSVPAAHFYAKKLGIPFMDRSAKDTERSHMLKYFTHSGYMNTIILTRVGDIALDLPEATVVIQISGLFASQRQEAQRLGRILRPKPPSLDHGMSFFYSLVSDDTAEVEAAVNRQAWLRDQGYTYRMLRCDEILKHYGKCREAFIRNELPSMGVEGSSDSKRSAAAVHGPMGSASPFSRPLACVGSPRWYYRIPVRVETTTSLVVADGEGDAAKSAVSASSSGGRVLRLKRTRDEGCEGGGASAAANLTQSKTTTHIRWMWMPFTIGNSARLEKAFVAGHHNKDAKLHLNNLGSNTTRGGGGGGGGGAGGLPEHPPLMLGHCEVIPLPLATRSIHKPAGSSTSAPSSSSSTCCWSSLGSVASCVGQHTKPREDGFHGVGDPIAMNNLKGKRGGGGTSKGKKETSLRETAEQMSAAADGSGGYVYFDTSDVPASHGEWTVTVKEFSLRSGDVANKAHRADDGDDDGAIADRKRLRGAAVDASVNTAKGELLKFLASTSPLNHAAAVEPSKKIGAKTSAASSMSPLSTMVMSLRIRRDRGPVEVSGEERGAMSLVDEETAMLMLQQDGAYSHSEAKHEAVKREEVGGVDVTAPRDADDDSEGGQRRGTSRAVISLTHSSRALPPPPRVRVDLEADHTVAWNCYYAFGDAAAAEVTRLPPSFSKSDSNPCVIAADEHDCCLPLGGTQMGFGGATAMNVLGHLLAGGGGGAEGDDGNASQLSKYYDGVTGVGGDASEGLTCVQHFSHTELGQRNDKY